MAATPCPRCGQANPSGGRFCIKCGGALLAPAPGASCEAAPALAPAAGAPIASGPAVAPTKRFPWLWAILGLVGLAMLGVVVGVVLLFVSNKQAPTAVPIRGTPVPPPAIAAPGQTPAPTLAPAVPVAPVPVAPTIAAASTPAVKAPAPTASPLATPTPVVGTGQAPPTGLVPYTDPERRFYVNYPADWRVTRDPSGQTALYKDSVEGTAFGLLPGTVMSGVLSGDQLLDYLAAENKKQNPDFVVTSKQAGPLGGAPPSGGSVLEQGRLMANWTNPEGLKVKGTMMTISMSSPVTNITMVKLYWYQAPITTFDGMLQTFQAMETSLRW